MTKFEEKYMNLNSDNYDEIVEYFKDWQPVEKAAIPQFMADYIEKQKQRKRGSMFLAMNEAISDYFDHSSIEVKVVPTGDEKIYKWCNNIDHEELFARAWYDGYVVEEK